MKVLSVSQIRALDQYTIKNEPIASIDLMERAAMAFCESYTDTFPSDYPVFICCGTGNNGGDGLAIARLLVKKGYKVQISIIGNVQLGSEDFKINKQRLPKKVNCTYDDLPKLEEHAIVIDALFGSGLSRPVEGVFADIINKINELSNVKVAVDIPSGLFADHPTASKVVVKADFTITFQLPKLAFFFPESYPYCGEWQVVDIGLSEEEMTNMATDYFLIMPDQIRAELRTYGKFSHKGTRGHALLISGSYGKIGATVLAARAALRSGLGLLSILAPQCGYSILQTAVPEAMLIEEDSAKEIAHLPTIATYNAIGIGPGIGQGASAKKVLEQLLQESTTPLVIDADALNLLSKHTELLQLLPKESILTPHPKEFERLVGAWGNDFERFEKQRDFSQRHQVIVVLKGAYTSISLPDGRVYFNVTGNPGMAKGGSGDVLLGLITGLQAQGYSPENAAILGVFLHGMAGDVAADLLSQNAMLPSDIIEALPEVMLYFEEA